MRSTKVVDVVLAITLSMILAGHTYAENNSTREHSIQKGAWALQFAIENWLTLESFDGMIALKKQLSDKSALRFGIGYQQYFNKNAGDGHFDEYGRHYDLKISLPYLRYPWPNRNIKLYWGVGPEFIYYQNDSSVHDEWDADWEHSFGPGLVGVLGIEWFATKEIGIIAEYHAVGQYIIIRRRYYTELEDAYEWRVDLERVVFGISGYF